MPKYITTVQKASPGGKGFERKGSFWEDGV